jgi:hypothetical protein
MREQPVAAKVARFQEMLRAGSLPPPISIMALAPAYNSEPRWLLTDGHHRVAAARREGFLRVRAEVVTLS